MRTKKEIQADIDYIKDSAVNTYIFGTGKIGTGIGYEIVRLLDIRVKSYCDNDSNKWGKMIKDGIFCISPNEMQEEEDCACIILTGTESTKEILAQVKEMGIVTIIQYRELWLLDSYIDKFYEAPYHFDESIYWEREKMFSETAGSIRKIKNPCNKIAAIYTCIVGDYDEVHEPLIISEQYDYYLISDKKPDNLQIYQWIDINDIVPEWVTYNAKKNRYCKINGNFIFSEYKYSVYIDGCVTIIKDIAHVFGRIGKSGMAFHRHPTEQCIYKEGLICIMKKFDDENLIRWQMAQYRKEKMPAEYGQIAGGIIVRENNHPVVQEIMRYWWHEVFTKSYRDQLSFMYCLWKNGLTYQDVGCLGIWPDNENYFQLSKHRIDSRKFEPAD